jgi:hypothetical protein
MPFSSPLKGMFKLWLQFLVIAADNKKSGTLFHSVTQKRKCQIDKNQQTAESFAQNWALCIWVSMIFSGPEHYKKRVVFDYCIKVNWLQWKRKMWTPWLCLLAVYGAVLAEETIEWPVRIHKTNLDVLKVSFWSNLWDFEQKWVEILWFSFLYKKICVFWSFCAKNTIFKNLILMAVLMSKSLKTTFSRPNKHSVLQNGANLCALYQNIIQNSWKVPIKVSFFGMAYKFAYLYH